MRVPLMMSERARRRAHIQQGGTIANYNTDHYTTEEKRILNESNNHINGREYKEYNTTN